MASIAIGCTLYGIFFVLASTSLVLLVRRHVHMSSVGFNNPVRRIPWTKRLALVREVATSPLIVANVLLILTVTANWIIGIWRLFIGVVTRGGGQAGTDFYSDLQDKTEVAKTAIFFIDVLIGDAVITYRTWLVWGRSYRVIIVPVSTISALVVFGIGLVHEFGTASPDKSVFTTTVARWVDGYCAATLCTNFYGTTMIAYRIWSMNRSLRKNCNVTDGRDLTSALAIFVESAALYSAWMVVFVIFYATKSPLQTVTTGCGATVIGIAFMLITVRVGLGWGQNFKSVLSQRGAMRDPAGRNDLEDSDNSFSLRTFALNVTQTSEQETDDALYERRLKTPDAAVLNQNHKGTW